MLFRSSFDIRIDSPTGKIIGSSGPINSGGWTTYITSEIPISNVTGIHDIYITFNSSINLNWITFINDSGLPERTIIENTLVDDAGPFFTPEPNETPAPATQAPPTSSATNKPYTPSTSPTDVSILLNKSKLTLGKNETFKLKLLNNNTITNCSFSTSNKKVATVSSTGKIKARSEERRVGKEC